MSSLRLVLGDQLSESISSLEGFDPKVDTVLMCEVWQEATYVKHHQKKLVFQISAMRHFAKRLISKGYNVEYVELNDPENTGSLVGELTRIERLLGSDRIVLTHPGEYRLLTAIQNFEKESRAPVEIREDDRFFCSHTEFAAWAKGRKQLRMEYFYREMRKKHNILMQDGAPTGGQWNFDKENRKPPKEGLKVPPPYVGEIDSTTQDVVHLVSEHFADHFGDIEPFYLAVTREGALQALDLFIETRLSLFGDYQDAMIQGEPWMYHSHISFYLNCGLLLARECVEAAQKAYNEKKAPLNAVEGFVRQVMGWREYVRGIYWLNMPGYTNLNFLQADRPLPDFYWTAKTKMNCIRQCVLETRKNAYAHHIQRLMILGNFALLAAIDPKEVNEWFLLVYADAYEWVELPNVSGMSLFADGGYLASKPYAAGGSYIGRMSNYCKSCSFSPNEKEGLRACPFNYLYWDFLERNRSKLSENHRLRMMYKAYDRMSDAKREAISTQSKQFLENLD